MSDTLDILLLHFNPLSCRAKNSIPKQCLLSIILRLPPSMSMVQIVILGRKFRIEQPQEPVVGRRWNRIDPNARMSEQLSEEKVVVADPPVIEAHGQPHSLQSAVGEEWHNSDVKDLLLSISEEGEKRVGMLGEVVRAVVFPKRVELVHPSVVPNNERVSTCSPHKQERSSVLTSKSRSRGRFHRDQSRLATTSSKTQLELEMCGTP